MQLFKRLLSLVLVLCLAVGLMIPGALAAEEDETTPPESEEDTTVPETGEETFDPYVFTWCPDLDLIPDYYDFYARAYQYISPHIVYRENRENTTAVCLFNLVNMDAIVEDENAAPSGGYATVSVLCADVYTYLATDARYRVLNLEDGYFNINGDTEPAKHIRAIMRHSFPSVSPEEVEAAANAYLTATYGEEAVAVTGLTGAQLLSATQSAIWHYANDVDYQGDPYSHNDNFDTLSELMQDYYSMMTMYIDGDVSFRETETETTATNIAGVYQYLISLPGEEYLDIVITDTAVTLLGASKVDNGDSYDLTVLLRVDGTINADDQLTLTAACGDQTVTQELTPSLARSTGSNLYTVTFTGLHNLARNAEDVITVEVSGSQAVNDVLFYEALPEEGSTPRETSQSLVGISDTTVPIMCLSEHEVATTRTLEICKIDAASGEPLPGVSFDLCVSTNGEVVKLNTYTTDENGVIRVDVSDDGLEYFFVETEPLAGYDGIEGTVTDGTVENSYLSGSLEVSKEVINASAAQDYEFFNFKVTLDLADAPLMSNGFDWLTEDYIASILESSKELEWTVSGDNQITATFTLQADESITINGIPVGTVYTVEEVLTEEDRLAFFVTCEVTAGDGALVEGSDNAVSGTIAEENAVLYTNEFVEAAGDSTEETTVPETTVPKDPSNPPTGDNLTMMLVLCVLSVMFTVTLYATKRRWA